MRALSINPLRPVSPVRPALSLDRFSTSWLPLLVAIAITAPSGSALAQETPPPLFGRYARTYTDLTAPYGVAVASDNLAFAAETGANRIATLGGLTTTRRWGRSGTGPLEFVEPRDLALGESLFVLDGANARVQRLSADGAHLGEFGRPGTNEGEFLDPRGLDAVGSLVAVADTGNHRVQILDAEGRVRASFGSLGSARSELRAPEDVALTSAGRVYIADTGNHRIVVWDLAGGETRIWGGHGRAPGFFARPTGLAWFEDHLFVVDSDNHRVQVFDRSGRQVGEWGTHALVPHEGEGRLHYPEKIAIRDGRALVSEPLENRVQMFTRGTPPATETVAGGSDSHFARRISARGEFLFVAEREPLSLALYRRKTVEGESEEEPEDAEPVLVHRFGRYGTAPGQIVAPAGLHLGTLRRLYVCDPLARRLQVFQHSIRPDDEIRFVKRGSKLLYTLSFDRLRGLEPRLADLPAIEPIAVRTTADDRVILLDSRLSKVLVFTAEFQLEHLFGTRGTDVGAMLHPTDLAYSEATETLYIVDAGNRRVLAFGLGGEYLFSFGREGSGPGEFVRPWGIAVDPRGAVFVTDVALGRVTEFDERGNVRSDWGACPETAELSRRLAARCLHQPTGVAVGNVEGRVAVLDHGHHRVQLSRPDPGAAPVRGRMFWLFGARAYLAAPREPKSDRD